LEDLYARRGREFAKGRLFSSLFLTPFKTFQLVSMLIRIVRMTFLPEQVPAFLSLFRRSEQRIRQQPGCCRLELWQDANNPTIYCTYSQWESTDALDAYRKSALFGEVWPATKRFFAAPPVAFSVNQVF
jgi:quinol monooxygenase YgiN